MASKPKTSDISETVEPGTEAQEQDHLQDSTRDEEIRQRAYEIYLERGGEPGHEVEDWLQAERELTTDESKAASE